MQKLSDSPAMRWTALVLLASAMFFAYIFVDVLSPLQGLLQTQRGWDPDAYGHFAGSEPFLNVFVFFLIFAGIILDKMGVRFTAVLSGVVMVLGAAINWYAVTDLFDASSAKTFMDNTLNLPQAWWNVTPWYDGMPASAKLSAIGFMIFGCGAEMAGITVSRGIVKWFTGHEMALAMGIEMAIARIGVAVVMLGSPVLASINPISVSRPVAASLLLVCIGLICFISYGFMDKKLDAQGAEEEKDDPFKVSDIGKILSLRMFWVVALLCVLYYSAIFPFQKYAINMLQCNLHFTAEQAGQVFFMFPLGAAAVTPFLGNFLDRKGKGASMLILGAVLMIVCHLIFAFVVPTTQSVIITLAAIIVLGISFSLVPAALWPSVPKLIDGKILSLRMFWVVALLCVLYYSAIFPFQKYAINMLQCNLHFTAEQAGQVFFMFPLGAAAVTPFLGNFLDRKGKGASMLILGAVLMIVCHLIFAFVVPTTQSVIITLAAIIVLGISFSLVPAALWPSVPKLIDGKLLGSAYALIFWIQNIGLYAFPMIIGSVLKASNPGVTDPLKYNYTVPMVVFASLGVAALFLGLYLKAIDRKGGYGLEEPNIKK